jgi:hypothetical protein
MLVRPGFAVRHECHQTLLRQTSFNFGSEPLCEFGRK